MTGRSYLSIGDVLTLLRKEFPDVTISKIRFLESQGLVNPERTPSGYRKFYEHDVERLTWVLRQQREHFLPLKVIKGRLEEETSPGGGNGSETQTDERQGRASSHPAVTAGEARPGSVMVAERAVEVEGGGQAGRSLSAIPGAPRDHGPAERGRAEHMKAPAERQVREGAPADVEGKGQELPGFEVREASSDVVQALVSVPRGAGAHRALGEEPGPTQEPDEATGPSDEERDRSSHGSRGSASAAGTADDRGSEADKADKGDKGDKADKADKAGSGASAAASKAPPTMSAFSGTSMTREEIAAATRLSPSDIEQLESFGLLSGRVVGGVDYFDEAALVIANLAAAFATYGVEARHLRLHLLSAQREAGFIEQIVLPLLKQRNPASRQRAHETVAELIRLGRELHAALLDKSLRELLGG